MRHLNFDCQLNLSKSHKGLVIISCVVLAQCRKVWLGGGGEKRPSPCEIRLRGMNGEFQFQFHILNSLHTISH